MMYMCFAALPILMSTVALNEQDILEGLRQTDSELQCIEAQYRAVFENSNALFSEGLWRFEGGRVRYDGHSQSTMADSGDVVEWDEVVAYDGEVLRTYNATQKVGSVRGQGHEFASYPQANTLLGWSLAGQRAATLCQLIEESPNVEVSTEPEMVQGVEAYKIHFSREVLVEPYGIGTNSAAVWVAPERSYQPVKIQSFNDPDGRVLVYEVRDIDFEKVEGLWMPIRGRKVAYANHSAPKEGVTQSFLDGLSLSERRAYLDFVSSPIPERTKLIEVEEWTFPSDIDDSLFTFEFPPGSRYGDDFTQTGYEVGEDGVPRPEGAQSQEEVAKELAMIDPNDQAPPQKAVESVLLSQREEQSVTEPKNAKYMLWVISAVLVVIAAGFFRGIYRRLL